MIHSIAFLRVLLMFDLQKGNRDDPREDYRYICINLDWDALINKRERIINNLRSEI